MANTPENTQHDVLTDWHRSRDPLRTRHGLGEVEYGIAVERYKPAPKSVFDSKVAEYLGAIAVGLVFGYLLALFI